MSQKKSIPNDVNPNTYLAAVLQTWKNADVDQETLIVLARKLAEALAAINKKPDDILTAEELVAFKLQSKRRRS